MDVGVLARYVRLWRERAKIERLLKEVKANLAEVEDLVLSQFIDAGVSTTRVDVDGEMATVYPRMDTYVSARKDVPLERISEVLRAHGQEHIVTTNVNASKLRSYFTELRNNDEAPPADVLECVNVTEKHRVGVKSA